MKLIKRNTLGIFQPYYKSTTDLTLNQSYNIIEIKSNDIVQNLHNNIQYNKICIKSINIEK